MNWFLLDRKIFTAKKFVLFILSTAAWISGPIEALAAVNVDGRLDEPEWATAQKYKDFAVVDPYTLDKPSQSTEAMVLSTPEGLAVAFICEQPKKDDRTHTVTQRDAQNFDADSVSLMIDFDGAQQFAYEFSVSISDSYRDGTIIQENQFNYDWDGVWKHAVNEEQDRWVVEILVPWSIAPMRDGSGEKRKIGVCFQRQMQVSNQRYAFPSASSMRPHFISDFAGIDVASYSSQELDITPYGTLLDDLGKHDLIKKAGVDLLWKPSGKLNVIGTYNPDFGTVESDNLVINFSAIETVFTEKRPFFIENQRIFDEPDAMDRVFYTRRIGGPSDKDHTPSNIQYALKVIGSTESLNYGFFSAKEEGEAGRSFYASQILFPKEDWTIGLLSTYADRPALDRTALVNCLEYTLNLGTTLSEKAVLFYSNIKTHGDKSNGFGVWDVIGYASKDFRWAFNATLIHFDDKLELNDMGYMQRNNFDMIMMRPSYNQLNFSEESRIASISWSSNIVLQRNTNGYRFPTTFSFGPMVKMLSGAQINGQIGFNTSGYDDLLSRRNGNVLINKRWNGNISYNTPRRDTWSKSIQLQAFQEGIKGWGMGLQGNATWYPNESFNINFSLWPQWSNDWLKWVQGNQLGSFTRHQVTGGVSVNWFPADGHEVWLKTQWYTVNAEALQSYHIGARGRLVSDNVAMQDFASNSFALQFRYRYELAPMSDLWFCYSRGGFDNIVNPDQSTLGLLGDSTRLRDSDQILLKLSYRFKVF
jgi:hypothetical protein